MDYPYLRAWNYFLGSYSYFCEQTLETARRDNAPQTAIFKDHNGSWSTVEDIKGTETKDYIEKLAASYR